MACSRELFTDTVQHGHDVRIRDRAISIDDAQDQGSARQEKVTPLKWTVGPRAPHALYKGTCTAHLNRSYYSPSGSCQVYEYDHQTGVWSSLPDCPQSSFALVIVNELLTAVGGLQPGTRTKPVNALQTFMPSSTAAVDLSSCSTNVDTKQPKDDLSTKHLKLWIEHLPPMPTRRACPSAVCHKHVMVVAGGKTMWVPDFVSIVEVLDICSLQWSVASSLPTPINGSTAAACVSDGGDDSSLFFLGGWDKTGNTVFTCSLTKLLASCVVRRAEDAFVIPLVSPCSCAWQRAASVPHLETSCVVVDNRLFVVGGKGRRGQPSKDIHMFNPVSNSWVLIGQLPTARSHVLVTCASHGLSVVGGLLRGGHEVACVEFATIDTDRLMKEVEAGGLTLDLEETRQDQLGGKGDQLKTHSNLLDSDKEIGVSA